ncbi:phenylacetate--CoA ligase family protein [Candidatus Woesearchaeota archaeon]|nr:phenylacetate--CoA ligase family protein [Candidatus Woesearchaeota archaeon]
MMLWKQMIWLHKNLPYPFLKMWGSSEKLVSWSRKLAFGGDDYVRWHKLLQDMEKWPLDKIYEFQTEKLKKILEHAYKNVPYYRETFDEEKIKPSDIKCLEDLQKLPIITKEDIAKNYSKFFARNVKGRYDIYRETSGTSGRSMRFYLDKNIVSANLGANCYFRNILGYTPWKNVILQAPCISRLPSLLPGDQLSFGYYSPFTQQVSFPLRFIGDNEFEKYAYFIRKLDIRHIEGHPSSIFAFARYIKNKNRSIKIKTALLGSEVLYAFQRKFIEKHLKCEVFNIYGSAESTIIAGECHEHKGMHIAPYGIAEVGNGGLRGRGELIMTNIVNYTFPIIRYRTKDEIKLSGKQCRCGRPFPRIIDVKGRINDFIILPDGEYLHPATFAWFSVYLKEIKDIHFLQHEDYSLDILVVKEEGSDAQRISKEIRKRAKNLTKDRLKFKIIFKDEIKRGSGKRRVVESKIPSDLNVGKQEY